MDYEFLRDITGVVKVRMSMDHEAIGHWFNEEVKDNLALLDEVEQAARTVKGSERSRQRVGHEYTLWLDGEEVMIRANQLDFSGDEIEEGMSYYDEESLAMRRGRLSSGRQRLSKICRSILSNVNHFHGRTVMSGFLALMAWFDFINHLKTVIWRVCEVYLIEYNLYDFI